MSLTGKTALVTGASRGIGRAAAIALAEAGANVAINYRSHEEDALEVADQVRKAGGQALLLQGDVADLEAVEKMVADCVSNLGSLDIAVSNAAYSDRELFHQADMEGFRRTVDVTLGHSEVRLELETRGPEHIALILEKLKEDGYAAEVEP